MIKQPVYALISALLLAVVLWFVVDRLIFLHSAQRTTGTVVGVTAENDRCGGRRTRYSCTQFHAVVEYRPEGQQGRFRLNISAGSARGHNQPVSRADVQVNSAVPVAYNPRKPGESYEDTIFGIWGAPLMAFLFQVGAFVTSLTEPRRRRYT